MELVYVYEMMTGTVSNIAYNSFKMYRFIFIYSDTNKFLISDKKNFNFRMDFTYTSLEINFA